MKNSTESKKEATPKAPKAKRQPAAKADKPTPEKAKPAKKAKACKPADRRPPWQWCEEHVNVDDRSPMPGRWQSELT